MKRTILITSLFLIFSILACSNVTSPIASSPAPSDEWSVQIIQNDRVIQPWWNNYRLSKQPFILQITFPAGSTFFVNVLDNAANYARDPSEYCQGTVYVFCNGTGSAEGTDRDLNTYLLVDEEGSHYWSDMMPERWMSLKVNNGVAVGQRYVRAFMYPNAIEPFLLLPIEEFAGKKLYVVMYVEKNNNQVIDKNEIMKFTITFK